MVFCFVSEKFRYWENFSRAYRSQLSETMATQPKQGKMCLNCVHCSTLYLSYVTQLREWERFFNSLSTMLEFLISYIICNLLECDHISSALIFSS